MANDLPIIQYHIIKNDFCRNKQYIYWSFLNLKCDLVEFLQTSRRTEELNLKPGASRAKELL